MSHIGIILIIIPQGKKCSITSLVQSSSLSSMIIYHINILVLDFFHPTHFSIYPINDSYFLFNISIDPFNEVIQTCKKVQRHRIDTHLFTTEFKNENILQI